MFNTKPHYSVLQQTFTTPTPTNNREITLQRTASTAIDWVIKFILQAKLYDMKPKYFRDAKLTSCAVCLHAYKIVFDEYVILS